jgi:hypothetical protein
MYDNPLKPVYAFVERAYVRMQAGDIIMRCLEEGSSMPMQHLVEELVLAGPGSLEALREIQVELALRKKQVMDDLHQMFTDLDSRLNPFGIQLAGTVTPLVLAHSAPEAFLRMLERAKKGGQPPQPEELHVLSDAHELLASLAVHIDMLEELSCYLDDWLWGVIYQSTRLESDAGLTPKNRWPL